MKIVCVDTNEMVNDYRMYLKTRHWNMIKVRYSIKHVKLCNICGCKERIELHHITYKNIGNEQENDLVWLCNKCHKLVHSIPNKGEHIDTGRFILDINKMRRKNKSKKPKHIIKFKPCKSYTKEECITSVKKRT